jgi:hypothetical protein
MKTLTVSSLNFNVMLLYRVYKKCLNEDKE